MNRAAEPTKCPYRVFGTPSARSFVIAGVASVLKVLPLDHPASEQRCFVGAWPPYFGRVY